MHLLQRCMISEPTHSGRAAAPTTQRCMSMEPPQPSRQPADCRQPAAGELTGGSTHPWCPCLHPALR
jgi:hypothetical protein